MDYIELSMKYAYSQSLKFITLRDFIICCVLFFGVMIVGHIYASRVMLNRTIKKEKTMKLKKFVNKINNHQFPEGSTFHIKKSGTIEQECYIEYQRDHAGIPILYLNELNLEDGSVIWHNELPASLLIDPDIRFVRRS